MRVAILLCAVVLACLSATARADTTNKEINDFVKALSFSDLKAMKKVASDSSIDFKARLDSEDRAFMHIVAMFWPGVKAASWVLKQGAEADAEDIHHDTPLIYCLRDGNLPCAEFLLNKGAKAAGRPAASSIYQALKHRHEFVMFNHGKHWSVPRGRNEHALRDAHYLSNPRYAIKLVLSLGVSPTDSEQNQRPHILAAADFRELAVLEDMLKISGSSGADLFSNIVEPNYAIGGGNALHSICTLSPYNIHASKIIIGHLNSGSNKTGVESQNLISKTKATIDYAFGAGRPLGPDIPWRLVDYFEHLDISSEDILKCSMNGDTSIDRKCLQDAMSSWNARFTGLILKHSKKLLPFQRDLRGETPLEICALHGDHESVSAMLQFVKQSPDFDIRNFDFGTSIAKAIAAASFSHWQRITSMLTEFASSAGVQLPSLNLPPPSSIACFDPSRATQPLRSMALGNVNHPPKTPPKPHVPTCQDPNQSLETTPSPPPLSPRPKLKERPVDLGGWGGAVFDVFDGHCDIDQIYAGPGGVSMEQFQRIYVQQRRPVLLRNATATWPVMKWWRRKKFQYLYNATTMDVFFNEKAVGGVRYTEKVELPQFLHHMDAVQSRLKKMGMEKEPADGILKRFKEIGLPNWLVDTGAPFHLENMLKDVSKFDNLFSGTFDGDNHAFQLMIAPPLTGASMHYHYTAANALIYGAKRWFLINPEQAMYSSKHTLAWVAEDVPVLRQQGIKILECTQTSGDILYVPSMWGHSVLYLSNTIGIAKLFSY